MSLPQPDLDDKTFAALVSEATKLIPRHAPDWTDHNRHDPGITFVELFSWLAEMQQFYLNRVGGDSFDGDISLKKAEETIGKPIFFQLPDDPKAMMGSRNAGVPLLTHAPRSKLQHGILQLAYSLCGKEAPVEAKKKGTRFFSFKGTKA